MSASVLLPEFARASRVCFVHMNPTMITTTIAIAMYDDGMPDGVDSEGAAAGGGGTGVDDEVVRRLARGCQRSKMMPHVEHSLLVTGCDEPHFGHCIGSLPDL